MVRRPTTPGDDEEEDNAKAEMAGIETNASSAMVTAVAVAVEEGDFASIIDYCSSFYSKLGSINRYQPSKSNNTATTTNNSRERIVEKVVDSDSEEERS